MSKIYNDPKVEEEQQQQQEQPVSITFTGTRIEIEEQPPYNGTRVGTRFCGCCCDYRRATIIMDIIIITLFLIYLAVVLGDHNHAYHSDEYGYGYDKKWEEHFDDYEETLSILLAVCIVTLCIAIIGVIRYNVFLVGLGALFLLIFYIVDTILILDLCEDWNVKVDDHYAECEVNAGGFALRFLLTVFFIYPHVGFIIQVLRGIMTPHTFERESVGCC